MANCPRHPNGASHRGLCPACLLEEALTPPAPLAHPERGITIQLPLGRTVASSVYLVKSDGAGVPLLRLKRWHAVAPRAFLSRFARLQRQLSDWHHEMVAAPLAGSIDGSGRAYVLDEFRQGVPIVAAVAAARLDAAMSEACLARVAAAARDAHQRGLVHGSIGGNVMVDARHGTAYLLDFGHAGLMAGDDDEPLAASADVDGLAQLRDAVRTAASARPGRL